MKLLVLHSGTHSAIHWCNRFCFWSITRQFIKFCTKYFGNTKSFSYIFSHFWIYHYIVLLYQLMLCLLFSLSVLLFVCLFINACSSFCLFPYFSIASLLWTVSPCLFWVRLNHRTKNKIKVWYCLLKVISGNFTQRKLCSKILLIHKSQKN